MMIPTVGALQVRQVARLLQNGVISSEQLALYCHSLAVAGEESWKLNAFTSLVAVEELLDQARASDARRAKGEHLSMLDGVPISVKSNLAVSSQPLTAGSRILGHGKSTLSNGNHNSGEHGITTSATALPCGYDADTVRVLLRGNGALLVGMTSMDEFGMGSLGTNIPTNDTIQPPDQDYYTKNPLPFLQRMHSMQSESPASDESIAKLIQMSPEAILEAHERAAQHENSDSLQHLSAGGSSAGSAASVAHGSSLLSLGSDTGGSVRLPSAWCGIVGLKPSYGLLSRHGLVSYASSFDTIGVLAPSIDCASIALNALTQNQEEHCGRDSTATFYDKSFQVQPNSNETTNGRLSGLKIGIPAAFSVSPCPKPINDTWQNGIEQLVMEGAQVEIIDETRIDPKLIEKSLAAYYVLVSAEASSNLARYDGFRYGHNAISEELADQETSVDGNAPSLEGDDMTPLEHQFSKARTSGFGIEVTRRLLCGTYVLSSDKFHSHYEAAAKIRAAVTRQLTSVFESDVDCLLVPTALSPPPVLNSSSATDRTVMFANDVMTVPFSLAGVPSMSVPIRGEDSMSVGLQVVGPRLREDTILRVGKVLEDIQSVTTR